MFGHQDDESSQQDSDTISETTVTPVEPVDQPTGPQTDTGGDDSGTPGDEANGTSEGDDVIKPEDDQPQPDQKQEEQPKDDGAKPEAPADDNSQDPGTALDEADEPEQINDVISPAGGFPKRPTFQYPAGLGSLDGADSANGKSGGNPDAEELLTIKKQALGELSPLVGKLDLPPEEKFRTLMMIIQADDDESLIKGAYEAAHAIEDETVRAQALLDIVNEVNYFTQPPTDEQTESTD